MRWCHPRTKTSTGATGGSSPAADGALSMARWRNRARGRAGDGESTGKLTLELTAKMAELEGAWLWRIGARSPRRPAANWRRGRRLWGLSARFRGGGGGEGG